MPVNVPYGDLGMAEAIDLRERRLSRLQRQKEVQDELDRRRKEDEIRERQVNAQIEANRANTENDRSRIALDTRKLDIEEGDVMSRRNRLRSYLAGEEQLDAVEDPKLLGAEGPEMSPERVAEEIEPRRARNFRSSFPEEHASIQRENIRQDRYDRRMDALQDRYDQRAEAEASGRAEASARKSATTMTAVERGKLSGLNTQIEAANKMLLEISAVPGWQKRKPLVEKRSAIEAEIRKLEADRDALESSINARSGGGAASSSTPSGSAVSRFKVVELPSR